MRYFRADADAQDKAKAEAENKAASGRAPVMHRRGRGNGAIISGEGSPGAGPSRSVTDGHPRSIRDAAAASAPPGAKSAKGSTATAGSPLITPPGASGGIPVAAAGSGSGGDAPADAAFDAAWASFQRLGQEGLCPGDGAEDAMDAYELELPVD